MRDKFIKKLAVVGLAVVFLLSMSSHALAPKGGKKEKRLYKVSISINDDGQDGQVRGIENQNLIGFDTNNDPIFVPVCGPGYFYAEETTPQYLIFSCRSEGRNTLGPEPENEVAPLKMRVNLLPEDLPIILEECQFDDGRECHGEQDPLRSVWWLHIAIYERQSNSGDPNTEAIEIYWTFDYELIPDAKGKKPRERGWRLVSWQGPDNYVTMTRDFPENPFANVEDMWWTDVRGTFVLMHDGQACDGKEDMYNHQVLEDFNIRIHIERVR